MTVVISYRDNAEIYDVGATQTTLHRNKILVRALYFFCMHSIWPVLI